MDASEAFDPEGPCLQARFRFIGERRRSDVEHFWPHTMQRNDSIVCCNGDFRKPEISFEHSHDYSSAPMLCWQGLTPPAFSKTWGSPLT
jgi:hypothetical protein